MQSDENMDKFDFLEKAALKMGAINTKVITVDNIYVENRVTLKCQFGCVGYGKRLTCPPYVPTPNEFRDILNEYQYALIVKFKSPAKADKDTICSIYKNWLDPDTPENLKEKTNIFWNEYFDYNKEIHSIMLELEKAAFNNGYTFALAFINGSCKLCEVCNTEDGVCIYPTRVRMSEHAVGINMKKTAKEAGMKISIPISESPEPVVLLLID